MPGTAPDTDSLNWLAEIHEAFPSSAHDIEMIEALRRLVLATKLAPAALVQLAHALVTLGASLPDSSTRAIEMAISANTNSTGTGTGTGIEAYNPRVGGADRLSEAYAPIRLALGFLDAAGARDGGPDDFDDDFWMTYTEAKLVKALLSGLDVHALSPPDDEGGLDGSGSSGGGSTGSSGSSTISPKIPRVIHLIWLGTKPPPAAAIASWRAYGRTYPHWEVKLWNDADILNMTLEAGMHSSGLRNQVSGQRSRK
jgi:hypothetical protein